MSWSQAHYAHSKGRVRLGIHKKGHGNVARGAQLWIGERPAARKSFFFAIFLLAFTDDCLQ